MAQWIKPRDIDYEDDQDVLEMEIKSKLTTEEIKRVNKQNVKHWRNGREQNNSR